MGMMSGPHSQGKADYSDRKPTLALLGLQNPGNFLYFYQFPLNTKKAHAINHGGLEWQE